MKGFNLVINLLGVGLCTPGKVRPFVTDLTNPATGVTKRCLCLPVEDCDLDMGRADTGLPFARLHLTCVESVKRGYQSTHFVKQHLRKETFAALSEAERHMQPILGNCYPIVDSTGTEATPPAEPSVASHTVTDVPF